MSGPRNWRSRWKFSWSWLEDLVRNLVQHSASGEFQSSSVNKDDNVTAETNAFDHGTSPHRLKDLLLLYIHHLSFIVHYNTNSAAVNHHHNLYLQLTPSPINNYTIMKTINYDRTLIHQKHTNPTTNNKTYITYHRYLVYHHLELTKVEVLRSIIHTVEMIGTMVKIKLQAI